jgi:hypothetical protein
VPDSRTRAPCPKRLRSIQGCKCVCVIAAMNYCQRSHRSFYMQYSTGRPVSAYECIERRNASNLSNLVVIFPVICCKKWSNPSNLLREENLLEILIPLYRLLGLLHVLQQITGKITLRLLGLLQGVVSFSARERTARHRSPGSSATFEPEHVQSSVFLVRSEVE